MQDMTRDGRGRGERIVSPIFFLVSLSSCSVILESDPQQVIQKVNFRVRVFLHAPSLTSPGCPSHPPSPLSSLHMGCQLDQGNPGSSSRSNHGDNALVKGAAVGGREVSVSKRDLLSSLPVESSSSSPSSLVGSIDWGNKLSKRPGGCLGLEVGKSESRQNLWLLLPFSPIFIPFIPLLSTYHRQAPGVLASK